MRCAVTPASGSRERLHTRLARRIESLLPILKRLRIRLVSNGAANPLAAADAIVGIARRLNLPVKVAAVTGDDVLEMLDLDAPAMETGLPLSNYAPIVSANAYLGAEALLPALASGADIVITGRVADPSLFVAPLMHEYGWAHDDLDRLARGTAVGHLLECAGQLRGFADPGRKEIPRHGAPGFPLPMSRPRRRDARQCRYRRAHHARHRTAAALRSDRSHGYLTPVIADFRR